MNNSPKNLQVVGDDLFTTNAARLARGVADRSANAILIKPNQNGCERYQSFHPTNLIPKKTQRSETHKCKKKSEAAKT